MSGTNIPDRERERDCPVNPETNTGRLHWVDVAKSIAIILVVIYHIGGDGLHYILANTGRSTSSFWDAFNEVLLPLRMPLFFLTAGLLARRAIKRSWAAVWRSRFSVLLWPYVLWSFAFACFAGLAYLPEDPLWFGVYTIASIPLIASPFWFLPMLAMFILSAKVLHRYRAWALAASLILAAIAPYVETQLDGMAPGIAYYGAARFARYFFWFLLGAYAATALQRLVKVNAWMLFFVAGVFFVALTATASATSYDSAVSVPLSASGIISAIGFSMLAAKYSSIRIASEYLAARTLPVYLTHPVLVNIIALIVLLFGPLPLPLASGLADVVVVIVLSATILAASLVSYDLLRNGPLYWLYQPPKRIQYFGGSPRQS